MYLELENKLIELPTQFSRQYFNSDRHLHVLNVNGLYYKRRFLFNKYVGKHQETIDNLVRRPTFSKLDTLIKNCSLLTELEYILMLIIKNTQPKYELKQVVLSIYDELYMGYLGKRIFAEHVELDIISYKIYLEYLLFMVSLALKNEDYYFILDEVVYEINNGLLPPLGRYHKDIEIPNKKIKAKSVQNLVTRNKDRISKWIMKSSRGAFLYSTKAVDEIWRLSSVAVSNQKNVKSFIKNEQLIKKSWLKKETSLIRREYFTHNTDWEENVKKYSKSMERIECRINLYESIFDNLLAYDTITDDFNFFIEDLLLKYTHKKIESYISISDLKQTIKKCLIILLMIISSKSRNGEDFQSFSQLFNKLDVSSDVVNLFISKRDTVKHKNMFSILVNELLLKNEISEAKSVKRELQKTFRQGEHKLDSDMLLQEYHVLKKTLKYYYDTSIKLRSSEIINKYREFYKKFSYVVEIDA